MVSSSTAPRAARWPAIPFLIWDLLGCVAFYMQSTADLDMLAKTDPYLARIWSGTPIWAWLAYGLAVVAGTAGAIALLLRSRFAVALSLVCVVSVLVQFGYTFLMTDLLAVRGYGTTIFPGLIILIAVAQLLYARSLARRGVLR